MCRKSTEPELPMYGRLRHIELALAREIMLLSKYERHLTFKKLAAAREAIRDADTLLLLLDEKRRKRDAGK